MARFDLFNKLIRNLFYRHGHLVARYPAIFLIIPLIIAGFLSSGMIFLTIETDAAYLFTPDSSRALDEFAKMTQLFPIDYEKFLPNRILHTEELGGSIVITARDGGNLLREEIMAEIIDLDRLIKSQEMKTAGVNSTVIYKDICCHFTHDQCLEDPILMLFNYSADSVNRINLTYPFSYLSLMDLQVPLTDIGFDFPPGFLDNIPFFLSGEETAGSAFPDLSLLIPDLDQEIRINIGPTLGGVTLMNNTDVVKSAKAMLMMYFLRSGTEEEMLLAEMWEKEFIQLMHTVASQFTHINVSFFATRSLSEELIAMVTRIIPRFCLTFSMLIGFAVGSCMMGDWVQSKPWLGQFGVISAMLAISSSIGLLSFCGVPFNEVAASMPFLAIGIGIDDMFIMLATWRKTSVKLPIEERLGQTFSEAAVSITITSATDALAFGIGSITPLPAVRVFCLYSAVAIIFDYLYQITFFGACMVYTGRREAKRKHCTTLKPVVPKDEAPSTLYRIFCAGGVSKSSPTGEPDDHAVMEFFRTIYGPLITKPYAKVVTVILYMLYVGIATFGCFSLSEGMQYKDIFWDGSYAHHYMVQRAKYFTTFAAPVSVVVTEPVAYWDTDVQEQIENMTRRFENNVYIYDERFTESWLRSYLDYLKKEHADVNFDNGTDSNREQFLAILQEEFLTNPLHKPFSVDVNFGNISDQVYIASSRFLVLPGNLTTTAKESGLMIEVREIADNLSLPVMVSSPPFSIFEQYVVVLPNILQNLVIATVSMTIISLVFIPNPVSAIMITFCIISIEVGVIGFMSLWNVSLNGVSMINIILCIGFSVDFSAHIAYAFVTAPEETGNKAAIFALHSLGMPILQGATSTIVGMITLAATPAEIFRIFFKTMFLVMVLGLIHGLLFLPVLLTILSPCMCVKRAKVPHDGQSQKTDKSSNDLEMQQRLKVLPPEETNKDVPQEDAHEIEAFL